MFIRFHILYEHRNGENMKISHIRNNFSYRNSNKNNHSVNFKSILSAKHTRRILDMLKPAISETIFGNDIQTLHRTFRSLARKYQPKGVDSYGIMIIPDRNLDEFCRSKLPADKLDLMKGFCVSAGGKYSPMEIWTEVYETKLVFIPKSNILI